MRNKTKSSKKHTEDFRLGKAINEGMKTESVSKNEVINELHNTCELCEKYNKPNKTTIKAIEEARSGKGTRYESFQDFLKELNK